MTGLIILLPLTLTLIVIGFIVNLLTRPFLGITQALLNYLGLLDTTSIHTRELQAFLSQFLILVFLFLFTLMLGALAHWFFFNYLIGLWERLITRIPLVRSIYKGTQDVIQTLLGSQSSAFKQVVMVNFPNPESKSIGFVTSDCLTGLEKDLGPDQLLVFIPTAPNPTSGFLVVVHQSAVLPLDMKVEDAFRFIISCGTLTTPFKKLEENVPVDKETVL